MHPWSWFLNLSNGKHLLFNVVYSAKIYSDLDFNENFVNFYCDISFTFSLPAVKFVQQAYSNSYIF